MTQEEPSTVVEILRRNADRLPSEVALEDERGSLTWSELWVGSAQIAFGLQALGVEPGNRVAISMPNQREFLFGWFGTAIAGGVEVPLDPKASEAHMRHVLVETQPRVVLASAEALNTVMAFRVELRNCHFVNVDERVDIGSAFPFAHLSRTGATLGPVSRTPEDLGAIMYTSGTSGPPKGVLMPFGQHVVNGRQAVAAGEIQEADRILICLPLHHNMAQGYGVMPALMAGCGMVLVTRFNRKSFWRTVQETGVTVFPFIGGLLGLLLGNEPSELDRGHGLRVAYGVPVPASIHERFERRFGSLIIHGYGSTEATIPVWQNASDRVPGSAGKPVRGFEVECRDLSDVVVPPGCIGEICIRPDEHGVIFDGYFEDVESTERAMRGGWFHSGDLGQFDFAGNLWFAGRMTDSIRRFGEFIDPLEIEELVECHPLIETAAAFGVPSEIAENEVMLVLVKIDDSDIDLYELRDWLSARLPRRSVPRYMEFLPEIPKTSTGKVAKYLLRSRGIQPSTQDFRLEGATSE